MILGSRHLDKWTRSEALNASIPTPGFYTTHLHRPGSRSSNPDDMDGHGGLAFKGELRAARTLHGT